MPTEGDLIGQCSLTRLFSCDMDAGPVSDILMMLVYDVTDQSTISAALVHLQGNLRGPGGERS